MSSDSGKESARRAELKRLGLAVAFFILALGLFAALFVLGLFH